MLMLVSCAVTKPTVNKLDSINVADAMEKCSHPGEVHTILPLQFPMAAQVVRHADCLGISNMLMVMYTGEATEKSVTAAKLLMLMYVEFQNINFTDIILSGVYLKTDTFKSKDNSLVSVTFFELLESNKEVIK